MEAEQLPGGGEEEGRYLWRQCNGSGAEPFKFSFSATTVTTFASVVRALASDTACFFISVLFILANLSSSALYLSDNIVNITPNTDCPVVWHEYEYEYVSTRGNCVKWSVVHTRLQPQHSALNKR